MSAWPLNPDPGSNLQEWGGGICRKGIQQTYTNELFSNQTIDLYVTASCPDGGDSLWKTRGYEGAVAFSGGDGSAGCFDDCA